MRVLFSLLFLFMISNAFSQTVSVNINSTSNNKSIGVIEFSDSPYGLLVKPNLNSLSTGSHGFHLHAFGSCADKAMAAMGHYDPANTKSHQGPYGNGHLGDLPVLIVDQQGKANTTVLAPRLKLNDIKGLAVMIHQGGDNYTDIPTLGGGGARIACGVIAK